MAALEAPGVNVDIPIVPAKKNTNPTMSCSFIILYLYAKPGHLQKSVSYHIWKKSNTDIIQMHVPKISPLAGSRGREGLKHEPNMAAKMNAENRSARDMGCGSYNTALS